MTRRRGRLLSETRWYSPGGPRTEAGPQGTPRPRPGRVRPHNTRLSRVREGSARVRTQALALPRVQNRRGAAFPSVRIPAPSPPRPRAEQGPLTNNSASPRCSRRAAQGGLGTSRAKSHSKTTLLLLHGLATRDWDHDNRGWGSYCTPSLFWGAGRKVMIKKEKET